MFCLSVLGQPVTKKRARTGIGKAKDGHAFRWAVTPNSDYEEMIALAFQTKYPNALPYGHEFCDRKYYKKKDEYRYYIKKGCSDMDLPKLELISIFYINGGKVGDLDNYLKSLLDALNGIAFVDDRQLKHFESYVVSLDDKSCEKYLDEDSENLNNCSVLERVDFIIKPYKPVNKRLDSIRRLFEKDDIAIDYTTRFYNDFRQCNMKELYAYAEKNDYDISDLKLKSDIIERIIECELESGGYADGKVNKKK